MTNNSALKYAILDVGWRSHLPKLPRPVIAFGETLWRALVHGTGFTVAAEPGEPPLVGFYTTYFVSGANVREALQAAEHVALNRWPTSVVGAKATGQLIVTIEEIDRVRGRFRLHSGSAYVFYTEEASEP